MFCCLRTFLCFHRAACLRTTLIAVYILYRVLPAGVVVHLKELKFFRQSNPQLDTSLIFTPVKLFTFIFAFYILLLSTLPCCAVDNCNDETQQTQTADKHEHNDSCQNCSPFTLCGNCVGFTFIANSLQVDLAQQFTEQTFSGYIQSYLPQYISSFWQPPRLG